MMKVAKFGFSFSRDFTRPSDQRFMLCFKLILLL